MATKKAAKKTASKPVPVKVLSDKEIVKAKFKDAVPEKLKGRFCIRVEKDGKSIHSGLAMTESDAWKRAAQACI